MGDRYRLYEVLGTGDTGEVWHALDLHTDRVVAVKLLYPDLAADPRLADRFQQARGELSALWHPSIARLVDVVAEDGVLALVTDLVPGTDLARRLARSGPLDPRDASAVAASIADALSAAHQNGVVHGDVKPSNVVIPAAATGPARLTDFAVRLLIRAGRRYPEPFDRLRYRAPEATDGAVPTPAGDVYALGAMLTEMLSGDPPARLRGLAAACVEPDPGARPSATEVCHELRVLSERPDGPATVTRPATHAAPRTARSRRARRARGPGPVWLFGSPTRMAVIFAVALTIVLGAFTATRALWGPSDGADAADRTPGAVPGAAASASGPTAPALPAAATAYSREGGLAFVQHWFALLTHAQQTGDTAELRSATSPGCADCEKVIAEIESGYAEGGSLRGGAYLVREVGTNSLFTIDRPIYEATVDRSPRATLDRSGVERGNQPGLTVAHCIVSLEWTDDRWRVLALPLFP